LQSSASVNQQDEWGQTALIKASRYNQISCVHRLLSQENCDTNIMDMHGKTALHFATEFEYEKVKWELQAASRHADDTYVSDGAVNDVFASANSSQVLPQPM